MFKTMNKKFITTYYSDSDTELTGEFIEACESDDNIDFSYWEKQIDEGNLDKDDINKAFSAMCHGEKLKVAQWLYSLGADIHADDDAVFLEIAENQSDSYEIITWLCSLCNAFERDSRDVWYNGKDECTCSMTAEDRYKMYRTRLKNTKK